MKQKLQSYFNFNRKERNGIVVLLLLIVLVQTYIMIDPYLVELSPADTTAFQAEIEAFRKQLGEQKSEAKPRQPAAETYTFFHFDPNTLPAEKWKQLGLRDWQIKIIEKYRNKGGRFRKKEDLAKIYGINEDLFEKLKPYIRIDKQASKPERKISYFDFDPNTLSTEKWQDLGLRDWQIRIIDNYRTKGGRFRKATDLAGIYGIDSLLYKKLEPYIRISDTFKLAPPAAKITIDMNSADAETFRKLKGIGPAFSERIVKYRKRLGGFTSREQLMEVYGIDSVLFQSVKDQLELQATGIQKININTAEEKQLQAHPYISKKVAREIISFRKRFRKYKSVEELKNLPLIDAELFRKIATYLTTE